MQSLADSYLIEIAQQLAFLGAFLGGFAATFLATLVVIDSPKRVVGWVVGTAAAAACSFVVAVLASVVLTTVLHPEVPANVRAESSVETARIVCTVGFLLGVIALLTSVGLSGWIRSRRSGIATSTFAGLGLVLVFWSLQGFR
jgi:hypothetical protein